MHNTFSAYVRRVLFHIHTYCTCATLSHLCTTHMFSMYTRTYIHRLCSLIHTQRKHSTQAPYLFALKHTFTRAYTYTAPTLHPVRLTHTQNRHAQHTRRYLFTLTHSHTDIQHTPTQTYMTHTSHTYSHPRTDTLNTRETHKHCTCAHLLLLHRIQVGSRGGSRVPVLGAGIVSNGVRELVGQCLALFGFECVLVW